MMIMEKAHKTLKVWQEAMQLAKDVYDVTKSFPSDERFGLTSQMRRSAVSIPSNIAEGAARQTKKDTLQFYVVARASLSEFDTQLELSKELGFINPSNFSLLTSHVNVVDSLLSGLIRYQRSIK